MLKHLAALAALLAAPAFADTVIVNANGIQVGADGNIDRFHSIWIADDGKIISVARGDQLPTWHGANRIDLKGKALLPGLIDAHGHMIELGLGALQLDLTGTKSLGDLQARLKTYAAANPGRGWIQGRGWNQELWADKAFPKAADLDLTVNDRPVWLERVDGHAAIANTAAQKAAGIGPATKTPAGGRIEDGLFVDAAMELVAGRIPPPGPIELDRAMRAAQRLMLSNGLTAATNMGTDREAWGAYRRAGEGGSLNVRVLAYASGVEALQAIGQGAPSAWLYADHLKLVGTKLYADGALGSAGAWLKSPYSDKPDSRGLSLIGDTELLVQASKASKLGGQLAIHAIGDAANAQVIGTFEKLNAIRPGDRRWRIEHAQVIDPADIPRLAKAGIIASMQPTHQTSDRLMAEKRLGPGRLAGAYAWQTIARSGARLAFGSDFPVESPNPFPGLSAAISRQDAQGQPPGGWRPAERVSFAQALAGFTRGAAYASFAEDRIGSLAPGTWADFIIIDRDPTKVNARDLARTQVIETWIAGAKVWELAPSVMPERG